MFVILRLNRLKLSAVSALIAAAVCLTLVHVQAPAQNDKREPVKLCIVMYHGLTKNEAQQNQYMIDPSMLEQDLQYLTQNGYHTIVVEDLLNYYDQGLPLPEKPVMLTFDDGYYNNYLYAYPLLQQYHCRAVLSPIAAEADKAEKEQSKNEFYSQCGWQELKEMAESGVVELQCHSYDLHHLEGGTQGIAQKKGESDTAYQKRLQTDLNTACGAIREHTQQTAICMVYPFGAKSRRTEEVIRSMGFRAAMDCEEKTNDIRSADDLYHLHRFRRTLNQSSEDFFRHKLK